MAYQDTALICKNGHVINHSFNKRSVNNTEYCEKCGELGIKNCEKCDSNIRGGIHYEGFIGMIKYDKPLYCHNCGSPYPWTQANIKALKEIIEMSDIETADKDDFNNNIESILTENPRTRVAALKIKNVATKLTNGLWEDVAKPLIVEISSEVALKTMGLK